MSNNDKDADPANADTTILEKGNTRPKFRLRRRAPRPPARYEIIDKEFARSILIAENGETRCGTVFAAIVLTLERAVTKGNLSALKILREYEAYAAARPKVCVENRMSTEEAAAAYSEFAGRETGQGSNNRKLRRSGPTRRSKSGRASHMMKRRKSTSFL